jgi:hypothetical protein
MMLDQQGSRTAAATRWRIRAAVVVAGVLVVATGCLKGADTAPKSGPGNNPGTGYPLALLTDVRHRVHPDEDGYDRVVLDFLNHVPAWTVTYVDLPVLADGSGDPVPLAGEVALQIRLHAASQVFQTPAAPEGYIVMYPGPRRIATGYPQVVELAESGDFEGVVTWNLGTRARVPFRVSQLDSPHRLIVDVAHR